MRWDRALCYFLLVLTFTAFPAALPAQFTKWVRIKGVGGEESQSYLDTNTVIREPYGLVLVQIALRFPPGKTPATFVAGTNLTVTLYEFDCAARKFRVGAGSTFDVKGNEMHTDTDSTYSEWFDPQPLSIGQGLLSGVCAILKETRAGGSPPSE